VPCCRAARVTSRWAAGAPAERTTIERGARRGTARVAPGSSARTERVEASVAAADTPTEGRAECRNSAASSPSAASQSWSELPVGQPRSRQRSCARWRMACSSMAIGALMWTFLGSGGYVRSPCFVATRSATKSEKTCEMCVPRGVFHQPVRRVVEPAWPAARTGDGASATRPTLRSLCHLRPPLDRAATSDAIPVPARSERVRAELMKASEAPGGRAP
jgi:hypothetical protein